MAKEVNTKSELFSAERDSREFYLTADTNVVNLEAEPKVSEISADEIVIDATREEQVLPIQKTFEADAPERLDTISKVTKNSITDSEQKTQVFMRDRR